MRPARKPARHSFQISTATKLAKNVSENTLADRVRAMRTAIGASEPTDERADILLRPNH